MYVEDTHDAATTPDNGNVAACVGHVRRVKAVNAAGLCHWSNFVLIEP